MSEHGTGARVELDGVWRAQYELEERATAVMNERVSAAGRRAETAGEEELRDRGVDAARRGVGRETEAGVRHAT